MSDTKAQPEPTMEEILASIRRIISENDDAGGAATDAADAAASPENVLELTEMVADDGTVVSLNAPFDDAPVVPAEAEPADDDASDDIPPVPEDDIGAMEDSEVTMEDAQEDRIEFSEEELIGQPRAPQGASEGGLMSDVSAAAATAAFASLSRASQSGNAGMSLGSGRTLEDLVQEMIRPMIKEWLDKNLPPMAERLVRKELERLSRRAEE
ncbi:MAG TPA: DUF2497 domain-containing protein [Alphaproteobacteria bacterium]|jgi:hypothetical protein